MKWTLEDGWVEVREREMPRGTVIDNIMYLKKLTSPLEEQFGNESLHFLTK